MSSVSWRSSVGTPQRFFAPQFPTPQSGTPLDRRLTTPCHRSAHLDIKMHLPRFTNSRGGMRGTAGMRVTAGTRSAQCVAPAHSTSALPSSGRPSDPARAGGRARSRSRCRCRSARSRSAPAMPSRAGGSGRSQVRGSASCRRPCAAMKPRGAPSGAARADRLKSPSALPPSGRLQPPAQTGQADALALHNRALTRVPLYICAPTSMGCSSECTLTRASSRSGDGGKEGTLWCGAEEPMPPLPRS